MDPMGTNDIALSKDGQYVAAVGLTFSAELRFYGRSSETPIWTYSQSGSITFLSVAISADGDCVAIGTSYPQGGDVRFWKNAKSRNPAIPGDTNPTWTSVDLGGPISERCLAISNDGNYLVAGGTGSSVYYWAGAKEESGPGLVSPTWQYWLLDLVEAVDISSDGDYVVAGTTTPSVAYWNNSRGLSSPFKWAWMSTQLKSALNVVDVAVSDDGNYVASVSHSVTGALYYWAGAKSKPPDPEATWYNELGAPDIFTSVDMSSDGGRVIAGASAGGLPQTGMVYFWDGAKSLHGEPQTESWKYPTASPVEDVAINSAGDYMAAANDVVSAPYVYFFDSSGYLKWTYEISEGEEAYLLSISSDGGTLAIGTRGFDSRYLVSTGYRTPSGRPVGGLLLVTNKLALISPWIAVALAALAITVFATKRRRKT